jgi:hypothetical protein
VVIKGKNNKCPIIDRHTGERYGRIHIRYVDEWMDEYFDTKDPQKWAKYFIPLGENACAILSDKIGRTVVDAWTDNWKVIVILERARK